MKTCWHQNLLRLIEPICNIKEKINFKIFHYLKSYHKVIIKKMWVVCWEHVAIIDINNNNTILQKKKNDILCCLTIYKYTHTHLCR